MSEIGIPCFCTRSPCEGTESSHFVLRHLSFVQRAISLGWNLIWRGILFWLGAYLAVSQMTVFFFHFTPFVNFHFLLDLYFIPIFIWIFFFYFLFYWFHLVSLLYILFSSLVFIIFSFCSRSPIWFLLIFFHALTVSLSFISIFTLMYVKLPSHTLQMFYMLFLLSYVC